MVCAFTKQRFAFALHNAARYELAPKTAAALSIKAAQYAFLCSLVVACVGCPQLLHTKAYCRVLWADMEVAGKM
jgi:hypothetical protein